MKKPPKNNVKKTGLLMAAVLAVLFLPLLANGKSIGLWIIEILSRKYTSYYRIPFVFSVALVLFVGIFFFCNRILSSKTRFMLLKKNVIHFLEDWDQRLKRLWLAFVLFSAATAILLLCTTSFPYAFAFTAAVFWVLFFVCRKNRKLLLFLSVLVLFLFWAALLFQGQDSHVKIFDNLDNHISHTKVLADSGKAFRLNPETRLDNFINGLPLTGIDSGYNVLTWLFIIFPPFTAFALNELFIRLFAFLGMFLLLKTYVIKPGRNIHDWIVTGSALCFALLPFYPAGGLSIAGLPLFLFCFLKIRNGEIRIKYYLFLFFFPFYSKLALTGIFVVLSFSVLFLVECLRKKRIVFPLAGAVLLLIVSYGFTHFHLVYAFLSPHYVSFRQEIKPLGVSTSTAFMNSLLNFVFDRVNVVSAQHLFIFPAAVLAIVAGALKKIKIKSMLLLGSVTLLTSVLWGFKYWEGFLPLRDKAQFLNVFDLSRFYWFNPFLWSIIFALSLFTLSKIKYGNLFVSFLLFLQILLLFSRYNWEYRFLLGIKKSLAGSPLTYSLSFREFYSESLFREIDTYIQKPKEDYRVVSIGIHSGIANYNGFFTLDIYADYYPIEYKHKFRRIIARELDKSSSLKAVFDTNAKRCYVLVSELHGNDVVRGMAFARGLTKTDQHLEIKNMELNTEVLKEMGGQYIFSAVEILNYRENGLYFERIFEREDSPWRIYLYRIL